MEVGMPRIKLNDCIIYHTDREQCSRVLWDNKVWGFGRPIRPSGAPEFIAYFRTPHRLRRVRVLGRVGDLTSDQAHGIARDIIGRNDPMALRRGSEHLELERQIRAI
jgi:hypothetical protein